MCRSVLVVSLGLVVLGVTGLAAGARADIYYVKADSAAVEPDGTSWAQAFPSIQAAIDTAVAHGASEADPAEVWVAEGTYTGAGENVVMMAEYVDLYGGFVGTEAARDARDGSAHQAIIDGEAVRRGVKGANNATLDGFTVTRGKAVDGGGMHYGAATNCAFIANTAEEYGGGMYYTAATNCAFTANTAETGGAMVGETAVNCSFTGNTVTGSGGGMGYGTASNCVFTDNRAHWHGGGMYDGAATNCVFTGNTAEEDGGGAVESTAINCRFTGNAANNGGALGRGSASDCTFESNTAEACGGAMMFGDANRCIFVENTSDYAGGMYDGTATDCTFEGNTAQMGGAKFAGGAINCTFRSNTARGNGGGVFAGAAFNCLFGGNTAVKDGGAMCCGAATDCVFESNAAERDGGGIHEGTATDCVFTSNTAGRGAGGMANGTASNCTFAGNTAGEYGGGMSHGTAENCAFTRNTAGESGGGMSHDTAINCVFMDNAARVGGGMYVGTATNCTFTGNTAELCGGVSSVTAVNCIIWGNAPEEMGWSTASHSLLTGAVEGEGNLSGTPVFVNPWAGDFRLRSGSPGIDGGTTEGAPVTDALGRARPQGGGVDMGAYEHISEDDADAVAPVPARRVNAASSAVEPDGLTWATAFPSLQEAADLAGFGTELWVAQGVYASQGENVVALRPGTAVYGGFAGTEATRDERSTDSALTIIDGQHARRGILSDTASHVNGVTVTNGLAEVGGGMLGGTASECVFVGNSAKQSGGAIYCGAAIDCTFTDNSAQYGGGMHYPMKPQDSGGIAGGKASNCTFMGNTAESCGGGMQYGMATNCVFSGNTAGEFGGGTYFVAATNSTFTGNTAGDYGGGAYYAAATNCTFTGNTAETNGGGMSACRAVNCIIWGNGPDEAYGGTVTFSLMSSPAEGEGNIAGNPLFADAENGALWLSPWSPCINAGTLDGAPDTDILGVPRPQGAGIDMGAYECLAVCLPVPVPDVAGLMQAAAQGALQQAGLTAGTVTLEASDTVAAGHVISSTPIAGTEVLPGTAVDLVVSTGPSSPSGGCHGATSSVNSWGDRLTFLLAAASLLAAAGCRRPSIS